MSTWPTPVCTRCHRDSTVTWAWAGLCDKCRPLKSRLVRISLQMLQDGEGLGAERDVDYQSRAGRRGNRPTGPPPRGH